MGNSESIISSALAIAGFAFGVGKHLENKKLKRKSIDRDAYLKIISITSQFTASIDKIILAQPGDFLTRVKYSRKKLEKELSETRLELDELKNEIDQAQLLLSNLNENKIEEYKNALKILQNNSSRYYSKFDSLKQLTEEYSEFLKKNDIDKFTEVMYREFKTAIDKLIFDLEENSDWKLFSKSKVSDAVKKMIDQARNLRFEVSKHINESGFFSIYEIDEQIFNFRYTLNSFYDTLHNDIR